MEKRCAVVCSLQLHGEWEEKSAPSCNSRIGLTVASSCSSSSCLSWTKRKRRSRRSTTFAGCLIRFEVAKERGVSTCMQLVINKRRGMRLGVERYIQGGCCRRYLVGRILYRSRRWLLLVFGTKPRKASFRPFPGLKLDLRAKKKPVSFH